jgi:hypothetical protein
MGYFPALPRSSVKSPEFEDDDDLSLTANGRLHAASRQMVRDTNIRAPTLRLAREDMPNDRQPKPSRRRSTATHR